MMEAIFVLAAVARELRLVRQPGYRVVAEPMLSLRIRGGLPMTVHPVNWSQQPHGTRPGSKDPAAFCCLGRGAGPAPGPRPTPVAPATEYAVEGLWPA